MTPAVRSRRHPRRDRSRASRSGSRRQAQRHAKRVRHIRLRSRGPDDTRGIGEALGRALIRAGPSGAVVALWGPLGTGKTCFVQGLARGLGVAGYVRSPTFVLVHEYRGPIPLYHVDLYRLTSADLGGVGLEEILEGQGVVAIEWPDHAQAFLPAARLDVRLDFGDNENDRRVALDPRGDRYRAVAEDAGCACLP